MKKLIVGMLLLSSFGLNAASADVTKKRRVHFVSADKNETYDQFSKHLDGEYYGELPFGGEYTQEVALAALTVELEQEYRDILQEDIEALLALDYLDLEEEETLRSMSNADGMSASLSACRKLLEEEIKRHDVKMKKLCDEFSQAGKDTRNLESLALRVRKKADELNHQFSEAMGSLEPFMTPRVMTGAQISEQV